MPDFDQNLQPALQAQGIPAPEQVNVKAAKQVNPLDPGRSILPAPNLGDGGGDNAYAELNRLSQKSDFGGKGIYVSNAELKSNQRYDAHNPTLENEEDFYAQRQSAFSKGTNGILKGVNLAATTIAGGFGMVGGLANSAFSGRLADVWDNPVMRELDEWNEKVDNQYLPNYYSEKESNSHWYQASNWFTANFLFDKLVKNSGFAVGAMVSGNIANGLLGAAGAAIGAGAMELATVSESAQAFKIFTPLLRNVARGFSAAKNIEVAGILEKELTSVADISAASSKLADLARTTNAFSQFGDVSRRTAIALYSTAGEASFEALQTAKEYKNGLIADFRRVHAGNDPEGADLKSIEEESEAVGKTSFLGNMALLGATEYAQLPKLLGSTYAAERQAANSLMGAAEDVVLHEGKYVAADALKKAPTRFGKMYQGATGALKYVWDPKEAAQEIGQYALQVGTQNYFRKSKESDAASVWTDGFLYGMFGENEKTGKKEGALVSKEGIEGGILGGLTGGLMQARGTYTQGKQLKTNTEHFINSLNYAPSFRDAFVDKMGGANRGVVLQQQQQQATIQGERLEARDLNTDMMHNYIAPRVKYGRFDMVMEDLNDLKSGGMTKEGLDILKTQGVANINDTVATFQKRVSDIQEYAKNTDALYKSANLRYGGEILKDAEGNPVLNAEGKQMRKYSPLVIDKMVYAASKVADYETRIPQVNAALSKYGVMTSDILSNIIEYNKPNLEATDATLQQINSLDVLDDTKEALKSNLSDVIELSLRRKAFMNEYNDIKNKPLNYEEEKDFAPGENSDLDVTVIQKEVPEGKKRAVSVEKPLEVGKQYSLKESLRNDGGELTLAPKMTVLSQTLGGEFEVRMPNGSIKFLTPSEFKNYALSEEENSFEGMDKMLEKAIDNVISKPQFKDFKDSFEKNGFDDLGGKLFIIKMSDNKLANAIEKEFNKLADEQLKEQRDRAAREESYRKRKDEWKTKQASLVLKSAEVPGADTTTVNNPTEEARKDESILFKSTTTESEDLDDPLKSAPHIRRSREFLNNADEFPNRSKLKTILVHAGNAAELGLEGIVQLSYKVNLDTPVSDIPGATDQNKGFLAQVYVVQDKGKSYFVDKTGKKLGQVGKTANLDDVVFQTMPTTEINYNNGTPKYRANQKAEAEQQSKAYTLFRKGLWESKGSDIYDFTISRGFGIENPGPRERNQVGGILLSEDKIASQEGLIEIPTTGTITHKGNNLKYPNGVPVLKFGATVSFLNNRLVTSNEAKALYKAIAKVTSTVTDQLNRNIPMRPESEEFTFIQSLMYWNSGDTKADNQIKIDDDTMELVIGDQSYKLTEIADKEAEITAQLEKAWLTTNNRTLKESFREPFTEFYVDKQGELQKREWTNYQSFLLASKYPDGSSRSAENTPLTTSLAKPSEEIPYAFKQRYSTLEDVDFPVPVGTEKKQEKKPPTPPTVTTIAGHVIDGTTVNTFKTKLGDVEFTASIAGDQVVVNVTGGPAILAIASNRALDATIESVLTPLGQYDAELKKDELAIRYLNNFISASLKAEYDKREAPQQETPSEPEKTPPTTEKKVVTAADLKNRANKGKGPRGEGHFRVLGFDGKERMTDVDLDLFKTWAAENVPNIPYEVLENIIVMNDGEKAWGVFENGVAKFVKGGLRGTEYHEVGEAIWNGMLSSSEQEALLDEFRDKPGTFTDRESGKKIAHSLATDTQAKERILDDFADYRLGKLPARSLGEAIRNFFKRIMDFFKSFVNKPSLKDELFKAIDTGQFKGAELNGDSTAQAPEYRRVEGLTEQLTHDLIDDMLARSAGILFVSDQKELLYSPLEIASEEIFDQIHEMYEEEGIMDVISEEAWKQLKVQVKDALRTRGIAFQETEENINTEGANKNEYVKDTFAPEGKSNSSRALKFTASTMIERVETNQEKKAGFVLPAPKESTMGGYKLMNFNQVFSTLLDRLSNTTGVQEFVDKLAKLAGSDANYVSWFQKVGGKVGSEASNKEIPFEEFDATDWRFFIDNWQTFSKQKPSALIQYKMEGEIFTAAANLFDSVKQEHNKWTENMKAIARTKEGLIKYERESKTYNIDPEELKKYPINNPTNMTKFLAAMGVEFPMSTYKKLKSLSANGRASQQDVFAKTVSALHKYIASNPEIMSISGKILDINGQLTTLAELYTKVTNPNQDPTYFGVEGQRVGSYSENNFSSVFENEFNESETLDELLEKRPELNDIFSANSQVLKKGGLFFDAEGNRIKEIKVSYIQGTKEVDDNKGITTSKLSLGDRFSQEINQNINGNYYIIIPADGTTEWMMSMGNTVTFKDFNTNKALTKVQAVFAGYLLDDVNLALENRTELKNVKNKATELRFFKDILSGKPEYEDVLRDINTMLNDGKSTSKDINEYIADNKETINSAVQDFIDNTVENTKKIMLDNEQIIVSGENNYNYKSLDSNFAKENNINKYKVSEELLDNILTFTNVNYIINNIEYHKILFGDPYQFKISDGKLDETKRVKSFLSPRRTTFDSPEFNTFMNQNMNNAGDIQLTPNDPGYNEFKPYITSTVLQDNVVYGSLAAQNKAYGNTDESDAFSWLMDNAYRDTKLRNKQWSDNAEDWHQWQMAYTRLNMPGYNYSNDALRAHDVELVSKPAPKHKIEVLKPIITGHKYGSTKADLLLHKTAQMPIYYSMVEGTNMEKFYIQMFKQKMGYAIVASGAKVGIEATHSLYNGDGSFNTENFNNTIQVPWKAYGIQVETTSEGEKTQTRGSQLTKMSSMNLFSNGEVIGATPERQAYIKKEYENNKNLLDTMHENAYNELLNDWGVEDLGDDFVMKDGTAISETLMREMLRRVVSDNVKDTLELDEDNQFKIPFEASPAYPQIRSILYSMIDKAIGSPKMHGGAHVQAPVTMFESKNRGLAMKTDEGFKKISTAEYSALSDEDKKKVVLTDDTLKFYTKEAPYCEVMLPHWFKDKFPKSKFPTGDSILKFLNSTKEGKEILTGIGFRIPTQALSSVEVFRVKGFLPQYMGSTVVVPSEITTKAGSDFDIDKLNMYLKSVYVDAEGNVKLIRSHGSEQNTKAYYSKVYDDVFKNRIERITKNVDINKLIDIFRVIENIETEEDEIADDLIQEALGADYNLFDENREVFEQIMDLSDSKDLNASDYLTRIQNASLSAELKNDFVKDMYKKSLENEYYASLERLITLPEVFNQLISPVGDAGLAGVAKELNDLRGYDETAIKNRLLDRNYMTKLRHAFVIAKKWVGISAVNITSLSLKQKSQVVVDPARFKFASAEDIFYLGNGIVQLPHNEIDGKISLSGTTAADSKELISDRYSGYATSFVDVAKDPYILDIIQSDLVVGTFMFLENIGAGKHTAYFLNQPIIAEYLKMLDSKGSKTLFNIDNIKRIRAEFGITDEHRGQRDGVINQSLFKDNIRIFYQYGKNFPKTAEFISEQSNVLDEFFKYAKMSSHAFKFTQATNYDTTRVTNGDHFAKKQWETEIAEDSNIISSVNNILNTTFIGRQERLLNSLMSATGSFLKLEDRKLRAITEKVLKPYGTKEFISADVFNRISNKIKSSFLDFIIQNKSSINDEIYDLVVNGETAVVAELEMLKQKYPEMDILRDLEAVSGERPNGAKSIKLSVNIRDAYDENRYTGMLREMRDENEELKAFYEKLIKVSIIQGTAPSAISIRNIIPLEDYADIVGPIMSQLQADPSLEIFAEGMFQKNQFKDNSIVPTVNPFFRRATMNVGGSFVEQPAVNIDPYGNEIFIHTTRAFPNFQLRGIKATDRKILVLSAKFNSEGVQHDIVKVPRIVTDSNGERVDMITSKTVTDADFVAMKKRGDYTLNNFYGYQKVRYASGEPLVIYDDYSGEQYVYKLVNLLGDGNRAAEYYPDNRASVIDNASAKIENEMTDAEIVEIYGGELTAAPVNKGISNYDNLKEFTDQEKESKLINFAEKYNMSQEQALAYINAALDKDRENVINKLKDCF